MQLVKPENFMRGAIMITAAAFISRILGSIYRPVAQIFIGDQGLALVTPPNAAYQIILALSAVGLNVAISRLVSERLAVEDYRGARHVFRVSTIILVVSGVLFGLLFALGARWLAAVQGFPEAWPGFMVLAPAIPIVTFVVAFRGLYQGMQQMRPSAVSQVVEQVGRVGVGLVMVAAFAPYAVNLGAAGFNAGNTVGVLLGAIYCVWIYLKGRPTANWTTTAPGVVSLEHESTGRLMGKILSIALPLSLIGAILPIMQQIDALIVTNRLIGMGIAEGPAREALAWLANAATLRDLPSILTAALYVSLVPAITESTALNRPDQARYRAAIAFRVTFLVGLPSMFGLLLGGQAAYGVLFSGPGYMVMAPLAWSSLFLMLQQTASGVLQGMGLIWVSVRNLLAGVVVKTVFTYWWTGIPALHASGAAYATSVAFGLIAVLNLWALRRSLGLGIHLQDDVGRPLAASLVMGATLWLISDPVHRVVASHRLAGLVVVGIGAIVYLVAILGLRGVTEADLGLIPGFRQRWIDALRRMRLLRE